MKHMVAELLASALEKAQQTGALPPVNLPEITIERPQNPEFGDYASSMPLKLARAIGRSPMDIAGAVTACLPPTPEIEQVTVAAPGFINFTLNSKWLASQVDEILDLGES